MSGICTTFAKSIFTLGQAHFFLTFLGIPYLILKLCSFYSRTWISFRIYIIIQPCKDLLFFFSLVRPAAGKGLPFFPALG